MINDGAFLASRFYFIHYHHYTPCLLHKSSRLDNTKCTHMRITVYNIIQGIIFMNIRGLDLIPVLCSAHDDDYS